MLDLVVLVGSVRGGNKPFLSSGAIITQKKKRLGYVKWGWERLATDVFVTECCFSFQIGSEDGQESIRYEFTVVCYPLETIYYALHRYVSYD